MKITAFSLLLATLFAAASAQDVALGAVGQVEDLEQRQATGQVLGATQEETQVGAVTTQWLPGPTSYLPYTFTQTFVTPVVQGPSPGVGTIGLGPSSVSKRDVAAPEETGSLENGVAGRIRA